MGKVCVRFECGCWLGATDGEDIPTRCRRHDEDVAEIVTPDTAAC